MYLREKFRISLQRKRRTRACITINEIIPLLHSYRYEFSKVKGKMGKEKFFYIATVTELARRLNLDGLNGNQMVRDVLNPSPLNELSYNTGRYCGGKLK